MRFGHSGKFGDLIYALPVIRQMGGGDVVMFWSSESCISYQMFAAIKPLLDAQPYIRSSEWNPTWSGPGLNLDRWRAHYNSQLNLCDMQAGWLDLPKISHIDPWLQVDKIANAPSIVFACGPNYANPEFPWDIAYDLYGKRAVFLGLPHEHAAFCSRVGHVPYLPTANLLEAARVIASADLFIGRQGGLYAIAEAIKVMAIVECYPSNPNRFYRRNLFSVSHRHEFPEKSKMSIQPVTRVAKAKLKAYIPAMFTEAHRENVEHRREFEAALGRNGIEAVADFSSDCDAIFCGGIRVYLPGIATDIFNSGLPLVHYVWDIYPFQVYGQKDMDWPRYLDSLRVASRILVPSACTSDRVREFSGCESIVSKAVIHPWPKPAGPTKPHLARGIVDVMRSYGDPNENATEFACRDLALPFVKSKTNLSWHDFQHAIFSARFLVSGYYEASTGGLSLLEGYWHGIPSLVSNSPRNGVGDYFGDRATYFQWDDFADLKAKMAEMWINPPKMPNIAERHQWIMSEYSEDAFARRIAQHLREVA